MNYAEKTVNLLKSRNEYISTAESVTGGAIANAYVLVSGASSVFYEGFVTYNFAAKALRLGVPVNLPETFGVISEECAAAMAEGVIKNSKCGYSAAITGVAEGCEENREAGTAFLGVANKSRTEVFRLNASGKRKEVISSFTEQALKLVYEFIKKNPN